MNKIATLKERNDISMATQTFCHSRLTAIDDKGNENIIYPVTTSEDVYLRSGNTSLPPNVAMLNELVDKLGLMAFVNKIGSSDLDEELTKTISELSKNVADLMYEPIHLSSFYTDITRLPLGSSLSIIKFLWKANKTPTSLVLTGANDFSKDIDPELESISITFPTPFTESTSFRLTATDERDAQHYLSTSIEFLNYLCFGVSTETNLTNPFDLESTELAKNKVKTFDVTAEDTYYVYYAIPTRFGDPIFTVGGFEGGFTKTASSITVTNPSGYQEAYDIWRSVNEGLGQITVTVG